MNKVKKDIEQSNEVINYNLPGPVKKILPIAGLIFLLIGFGGNIDMASTVQKLTNDNLKISRSCHPKVSSTELEYLSLGLNLSQFKFDDKCPAYISSLENIYIGFRGISFSPLGVRLKIIIKLEKVDPPIAFNFSAGTSGFKIVIDNQQVELKNLIKIADAPIKAKGTLTADGLISGKYSKINNGTVELNINQLQLSEQEIQGFILPPLLLKENVINIGFSKKNIIKVNSLKLGSKGDVAEILAQGEIKTPQSLRSLTLDIEGKFNFTDELNKSIPLIGLMLNGKKKSQGYYQFEMKGGVNKPQFKVK